MASVLRRAFCAAVFAIVVTGCGSNSTSLTPAAGAVTSSVRSLSFTSVDATLSVTVSQSDGSGSFAVSGCPASIVSAVVNGSTIVVTSHAVGSCSLVITGADSQNLAIPVVVSTAAVTGS